VHPLQVMAAHAIKTLDIDSNRLVMEFMFGLGKSPTAHGPFVCGFSQANRPPIPNIVSN
jgi:hypothetical protein